ncbi:Gfo/Idh/MocA family oxidoreductase [Microbacterium sp. M3]|uniref:Gfo/Idh/MocA family oxidoreductase n=1 Tax=Microbacterium arthrosphaerae TaxID=792652 RepID=A0ABU4H6A3_9MICO|nr:MULTISPECIES: Gfo/Idh/MocA family oxidoreductase [Microbacterium]MDW4574169.1 Gfo/Idh/MocA family oxidoreductase [Microbacterium arthrosphaerae]MDW7608024.1 Gfo/Idh/MocA family oxidoreductase [Microbacterium sp. M3]
MAHETNSGRTRWAVLGPGAISRDFVVGLRASEHGVLHAVGSSSADRAAAFAAEHGAEASGTYDEVLARDDVDAVYVGTVHTTHADLAIRALEAGKAVLCEKPASPTLDEVERILAAAERAQRPFLEAFKTRFGPFAEALRQLARSGELGALQRFEGAFGFDAGTREGRLFDPALAGGAILDVGCYPLALAIDLAAAAGQPVDQPEYRRFEAELVAGVDGTASAELVFGDVTALIATSVIADLPDTGVLRFAGAEVVLPHVWGSRTESPSTLIVRRDGEETHLEVPVVQPMAAEADALSLAIAEGRREVPQMPWSHTRAAARVLTDWRDAALAG